MSSIGEFLTLILVICFIFWLLKAVFHTIIFALIVVGCIILGYSLYRWLKR
jgi:hypothetical protein